LLVSIFFALRQNNRIPYYFKRSRYFAGEIIKLTLAQEVSFLTRAVIKETLEKLPKDSTVIIDATNTEYIDFDVVEIIRDFYDVGAKEKRINVSLEGFKASYNFPSAIPERELVARFLNVEEVPVRTYGTDKTLLSQLKNEAAK
jgi:MFS superfamily sulfate permease-like transporter